MYNYASQDNIEKVIVGTTDMINAMSDIEIKQEVQRCLKVSDDLLINDDDSLARRNAKLYSDVAKEFDKIVLLRDVARKKNRLAITATLLVQAAALTIMASWMFSSWLLDLPSAFAFYERYQHNIPIIAVLFTVIYFLLARLATVLMSNLMIDNSVDALVHLRLMINDGR